MTSTDTSIAESLQHALPRPHLFEPLQLNGLRLSNRSVVSPMCQYSCEAGDGGSFENRTRLTLEVVDAIRARWPRPRPLLVRLSATDWVVGGWDVVDTVRLAERLKERGVDLIDCSSGGLSARQQIPLAPGYQVEFAERVRREAGS